MKTFILILFNIILSISVFAQDSTRILLSLDGAWKFVLDSANVGVKEHWPHGIPTSRARQVTAPHTWNIEPGSEEYAGTAWYQKEVKIDEAWKQKALHLKFQAVYHDAVVYVNGTKVGENLNSGYTPFQIDITPCVQFNRVNTLVVRVNNEYSDTMFPYQKSFDWMNDGGIIRPVSLEVTGKPALQSVHLTPTLHVADSTGAVVVAVKLWETNMRQATFTFVFKEKSTGTRLQSKTAVLRAEQGVFTAKFQLGKIKPWHFDSPALYTLVTSVAGKGEITDQEISVFGFKKVEIKGRDFFLNGEKVRLPGLEYMPGSHPKYGAAEPFSYLDSVAHALKDLNVCITRFHWQQDARLLSLFDEYGILVQEEMPWWQSPGNLTPALMQTAHYQWQTTIGAHYNHPCIFAWGLSNEVYGNTDKNQYLALRDFVKSLDPSRLVTVVSNEIWNRKEHDESLLCDIPTWNEYVGTWHGKSRDEVPGKFEIIQKAIGDRPLLITENGLCEPYFTGGDPRRIDEMLFHVREWCQRPFVMGYIYFCLNDYRTHIGEEGFGKFKIRRHGITDMYLSPKPSYSVLKQLAAPINITKVARLNATDAQIEIKVKNEIPSYTLRGYKIQYTTRDGNRIERTLPDLKPGASYPLELVQINPRFAFKIVRPNGFGVTQY